VSGPSSDGAAGPRPYQVLGWALIAYGLSGILVLLLALAVLVPPLLTVGNLGVERQDAVAFLDSTVQALDAATSGSGDAGATLTAAAKSAHEAAGLSDGLARSMSALGNASDVSILGSRPLAGLAGQFAAVGTEANQLSATMTTLAATLGQNTIDFATLQADLAAIRQQVAGLRAAVAASDGLDGLAPGLAPLVVLISIWMAVPAVAGLAIGVRLLRRPDVARGTP